jgi:hypothetical protein
MTLTIAEAGADLLETKQNLLANQNATFPEGFEIIEPQWWTGEHPIAPDRFTLDCRELAARMNKIFDDVGLLYLTNTGWSDLQEMRRVAMLVIKKQAVYRGGSNPRGALQPNVYEVGAPTSAFLHYHHEMAYVNQSATMLGFLCQHALPDSGYTLGDSVWAKVAGAWLVLSSKSYGS